MYCTGRAPTPMKTISIFLGNGHGPHTVGLNLEPADAHSSIVSAHRPPPVTPKKPLDLPTNIRHSSLPATSNYFPIHSRLARRQTYAQQSRPRHIAQPARKDEVAQPASLERPVSPVYERPVPCVQQLSCRRRQGCCGILCVAAPMKCSTGRRRRHDKRGAFHVRVTTLLT